MHFVEGSFSQQDTSSHLISVYQRVFVGSLKDRVVSWHFKTDYSHDSIIRPGRFFYNSSNLRLHGRFNRAILEISKTVRLIETVRLAIISMKLLCMVQSQFLYTVLSLLSCLFQGS